MNIETGKTYVTAEGFNAVCLEVLPNNDGELRAIFRVQSSDINVHGTLFKTDATGKQLWRDEWLIRKDCTIVREYVPPAVIEGFMNVYNQDGRIEGYLWEDKAQANATAGKDRIACIPVSFTEGEGLTFDAMVGDKAVA